MAAVPVELRGTLYDLQTKSARQVYIVAEMHRSDLSVGGGPVYPPGGDGKPPGTWGGAGEGFPTPPIHLPPIEGPPGGGAPPPDGGDKPPPDGGGWGFVGEWSKWGYFPGPGQAQPKA